MGNDRNQPLQHCADVALRIAHENETRHARAVLYDQIAEAFVFRDQSPALIAGPIENCGIAPTLPLVPYCQHIVTRAAQPLDQSSIQAFVREQPHAASGWPNSMSSLRR